MDSEIQQLRLLAKHALDQAFAIAKSEEYQTVKKFYGDRTAIRSGVPLINHINEGLEVLYRIDASLDAMKAYALHPLLQADTDLADNFESIANNKEISPRVLMLAMEYRNIANAYLSLREIKSIDEIDLSPIDDVNDMLIADKVQNYKDFLIYHADTHPRSVELDVYFNNWIDRLDCRDTFTQVFNKKKLI